MIVLNLKNICFPTIFNINNFNSHYFVLQKKQNLTVHSLIHQKLRQINSSSIPLPHYRFQSSVGQLNESTNYNMMISMLSLMSNYRPKTVPINKQVYILIEPWIHIRIWSDFFLAPRKLSIIGLKRKIIYNSLVRFHHSETEKVKQKIMNEGELSGDAPKG